MSDSLCYKTIPVTPFAQNASILWCVQTKKAAITDPGGDLNLLLDALDALGLTLEKILLTHGHIDHIGFTADLAKQTGTPIIGPHQDDQFLLDSLDEYSEMLKLPHSGSFTPKQWLSDGDTVSIGNQSLEVVHCPGHTPGHIIYYHAPSKLAVVGDVLFNRGIGRTDFPRGNHADLIHSITQKLLPLGDDIEFIPGHGPNSTFGDERVHNPFLQS